MKTIMSVKVNKSSVTLDTVSIGAMFSFDGKTVYLKIGTMTVGDIIYSKCIRMDTGDVDSFNGSEPVLKVYRQATIIVED